MQWIADKAKSAVGSVGEGIQSGLNRMSETVQPALNMVSGKIDAAADLLGEGAYSAWYWFTDPQGFGSTRVGEYFGKAYDAAIHTPGVMAEMLDQIWNNPSSLVDYGKEAAQGWFESWTDAVDPVGWAVEGLGWVLGLFQQGVYNAGTQGAAAFGESLRQGSDVLPALGDSLGALARGFWEGITGTAPNLTPGQVVDGLGDWFGGGLPGRIAEGVAGWFVGQADLPLPGGGGAKAAARAGSGGIRGVVSRITGQAPKSGIHGNRIGNPNPSHRYVIVEKETGALHKTGISSGKLNENGTSRRGNTQVNELNKRAGYDRYKAVVVERNATRVQVLESERKVVDVYYRRRREMPPGMKLPEPR
ncbi:MAG: hypothetical protein AB1646_09715 [Thermodesulfobacteriota bacterium]